MLFRSLRVWLIASASILAIAPASANEPTVAPRPFDARYHLQIKGWPDARIEHRLTRQVSLWQSDMSASVAVAKGSETSRFRVSDEGVRAIAYSSGYSLLGAGSRYRLSNGDLAPLPDRQAALFMLSRQATRGECDQAASPCKLSYQDHKGREETLHYRVVERGELALPAGEFQAVTVEAWEAEHPDRRMIFNFHPGLPGLLLTVEYHRDGERKSQLFLTALNRPAR